MVQEEVYRFSSATLPHPLNRKRDASPLPGDCDSPSGTSWLWDRLPQPGPASCPSLPGGQSPTHTHPTPRLGRRVPAWLPLPHPTLPHHCPPHTLRTEPPSLGRATPFTTFYPVHAQQHTSAGHVHIRMAGLPQDFKNISPTAPCPGLTGGLGQDTRTHYIREERAAGAFFLDLGHQGQMEATPALHSRDGTCAIQQGWALLLHSCCAVRLPYHCCTPAHYTRGEAGCTAPPTLWFLPCYNTSATTSVGRYFQDIAAAAPLPCHHPAPLPHLALGGGQLSRPTTLFGR